MAWVRSSDSRHRFVRGAGLLVCCLLAAVIHGRAQAQTGQGAAPLTQRGQITAHGITLSYPTGWFMAQEGNNARLVSVAADRVSALDAQGLNQVAQIFVSVDTMRDHAAALRQLENIRSESSAPTTFLRVGGWPALQRRSIEPREQPGREDDALEEPDRDDPSPGREQPERPREAQKEALYPLTVLKLTTVVAAGNLIIRLDGRLPPDAPANLEATARAIEQTVTFRTQGDPTAVDRELTRLRATPPRRPARPPRSNVLTLPPTGATPGIRAAPARRAASGRGTAPAFSLQPAGLAQLAVNNASEAEIAVSTNGQNIIIAQGFSYSTSTDGGQNWTRNLAIPQSTGGDGSVAFGRSGTFYVATINGSSTAIHTSNAALTLAFQGNAFTCTATALFPCGFTTPAPASLPFPDQEHIAADRFNAGNGGGDQVYSVWRNANNRYGIVCNNGQAWGGSTIRAGDFPRITVGQDGRVYVVYQNGNGIFLDRYSSCTAGLALQVNAAPVATLGPNNWVSGAIPCAAAAMPGLDRCNSGNNLSSFTVAVDDLDATHIFVAYAQNTAANNENIVVQDSTDSGQNWLAARTVTISNAAVGRRFMPWACSVGGAAYVTWFDRRAAIATNISLTDFYGGSAARNGAGTLVAGAERRINPANTADNQCEAGQIAGSNASWPRSVRAASDSETCTPQQPQLAGRCFRPAITPQVGSGNSCDFSTPNCPVVPFPETCQAVPGGGVPKYGDYNGSACSAGRVYAIWPSATTPPPTIGPAGAIDLYYASLVVAASQIQIPGPVVFADTCVGSSALATANVCNTGTNPLHVDPITSSDPQFSVATPSSGYPVTIAPGSCFPFQVRFTPSSAGNKSAALTVPSDDTVSPNVNIFVSGRGTQAAMTTMIADAGDFGTVTPGSLRDQPLVIANPGSCPLTVINLTSSAPDFQAAQVTSFPFTVASGTAVSVPIRFQPTSVGPKPATLTITSNDPGGAQRQVRVSGTGGAPVITTSVVDTGSFGQVCVGDPRDLDVTVTNSGVAPLVISAIASSSPEFQVPQVLVFPLVVAPGTSLEVPIRLAPTTAGPKTTTLTLSSNDPATPAKTVTLTAETPAAELCHAPSFTSVGLSIGPTFGSTRTGDFTVTAQGRQMVPFGERHSFAFQGQGEYRYYEGRHEGEVDFGLIKRRREVQFGVFANLKFADFAPSLDGGSLGQASAVADVLLTKVRLNFFGTKGFKDVGLLDRPSSLLLAPVGVGIPVAAIERIAQVTDAYGGGAQAALAVNTDIEGHLMWLRRARPSLLNDRVGADLRVTQHLTPQFALFGELTLNETLVGSSNNGAVVFGFVFGRWTRPSDLSNKHTPLGMDIPTIHYDLRTRVR